MLSKFLQTELAYYREHASDMVDELIANGEALEDIQEWRDTVTVWTLLLTGQCIPDALRETLSRELYDVEDRYKGSGLREWRVMMIEHGLVDVFDTRTLYSPTPRTMTHKGIKYIVGYYSR